MDQPLDRWMVVDATIVHYDHRIWCWEWLHGAKQTLDEFVKCVGAEGTLNDVTIQDSSHWECWKDGQAVNQNSVVNWCLLLLENSLLSTNKICLVFGLTSMESPSTSMIGRLVVDRAFINENKLFGVIFTNCGNVLVPFFFTLFSWNLVELSKLGI